jgi:hypothetical protein
MSGSNDWSADAAIARANVSANSRSGRPSVDSDSADSDWEATLASTPISPMKGAGPRLPTRRRSWKEHTVNVSDHVVEAQPLEPAPPPLIVPSLLVPGDDSSSSHGGSRPDSALRTPGRVKFQRARFDDGGERQQLQQPSRSARASRASNTSPSLQVRFQAQGESSARPSGLTVEDADDEARYVRARSDRVAPLSLPASHQVRATSEDNSEALDVRSTFVPDGATRDGAALSALADGNAGAVATEETIATRPAVGKLLSTAALDNERTPELLGLYRNGGTQRAASQQPLAGRELRSLDSRVQLDAHESLAAASHSRAPEGDGGGSPRAVGPEDGELADR